MRQRIYLQKGCLITKEDWLAMVTLLAKSGYTVRIGQEKDKSTVVKFIEYWVE